MHLGYDAYGCGYPAAPVAGVYDQGCAYPVAGVGYGNNWFALIVVLFILLIIIGASCYGGV